MRKKPTAAAVAAKICGLVEGHGLRAAIEGGASYLGFVFVPFSKRFIDPMDVAGLLRGLPQPTLCRFSHAGPEVAEEGKLVLTGLFADPTDKEIERALYALRPCLGLIQLHGRETPGRVAHIREKTGVPVMKAIPVATKEDLDCVPAYEAVADMLLFDAKVRGQLGGTGQSFDWSLLKGLKLKKPWMLAGGLDAENVRAAIKASDARIVDVSSGVETRAKKDPEKIRIFLNEALRCTG